MMTRRQLRPTLAPGGAPAPVNAARHRASPADRVAFSIDGTRTDSTVDHDLVEIAYRGTFAVSN